MDYRVIDSTFPAGHYYFSGNEAVAEGAIAAGCRYYAGYHITPLSEIIAKFCANTEGILGHGCVDEIINMMWQLDSFGDISKYM